MIAIVQILATIIVNHYFCSNYNGKVLHKKWPQLQYSITDYFPNASIEKSDEDPACSIIKNCEKLLMCYISSIISELGEGINMNLGLRLRVG